MMKCTPQCSFAKYDMTTTSTKFPTRDFAKYQKSIFGPDSNMTHDYMRRNLAELSVSMASLTVSHTTTLPKYEIFSTGSAMGGLFGLLLGGSMMTLYEVSELIVSGVYHCGKTSGFLTRKRVSPT